MSNTLFTASCKWKGTEDNEELIYLGGTTQETYDNLLLIDSLDPDYPASTAFYFRSTESDIYSRDIYPTQNDLISITGISNSINYGVDNNKNLLIIDPSSPLTNVSSLRAKLVRNYASIFSANSVSFKKVIDLQSLNERAITAMVSISGGIYLSGTSGNIWFYNGDYVKGPLFTAYSNGVLPISSLCVHKFDHETEEYLYAGSDVKPRLFRAPLSTAFLGTDWESVYNTGDLSASTGGILSLVSAFNKLFLGCRKNKILIYSRVYSSYLDQPSDFITEAPTLVEQEQESLTTQTLTNPHIADLEPKESGIKCLEVGKNQVFAGLDNTPHIYSYSEIITKNPDYSSWANILLDEVFMRDPAPAQFYSGNNLTDPRNSSKLSILKFQENTANKTKDVLFIKGDSTTSSTLYEIGIGSDWEQIQNDILPTQAFINVRVASTETIYTFNNFSSLDGVTLDEGDLFILKNQSSLGTNGIYNNVYKFYNSGPIIYTPIFESNSTKLGFYVTSGYVNADNRFLLNISDYTTNTLTFYKPKYTLEFEALNLSSGKTTESNVIDGNVYLGIDGQVINNSNGYSYNGYQGLDIQDCYGKYSIEFNPTTMVIASGSNKISKPLITTGIIKNWSFRNDTNPASPVAFVDGWINYENVTVTATSEADFNLYNLTYDKYILNLATSLTGDLSIYNSGLSLIVDASSFVKIKVKIPPVFQSFSDAYIDFSWAYETGQFTNKTSTKLASSNEYVEYILKPTWKGKINKVLITFRGLPTLSARPANIKIDYIQILSDDDIFDLNSTLSKVRVGVDGRDLKVWLGNQYNPFIDIKNFIAFNAYSSKYVDANTNNNDYEMPNIKIGKLNNYAGESLCGFSRISFVTGDVYAPVVKSIEDFSLSTRLSSTGGVRLFTYHNGTLYCVTDGIVSTKLSDNPDDRQIKLFTYKADQNFWEIEESYFERKTISNVNGTYQLYGVVRPLTSISYKNTLYVSGQYGNIKSG